MVINDQNLKISKLTATIVDLNSTLAKSQKIVKDLNHSAISNEIILRSYVDLFCSNVTPPVSKLDAVDIALGFGNWTQGRLYGKRLTATLMWAVFSSDEFNTTNVFLSVLEVTQPVADYSARWEGDRVFRYVWQVAVTLNEMDDVEYWVDASSGEVFITPIRYPPN